VTAAPPNWADDPLLADEVRARAVRHGIIRSAVILDAAVSWRPWARALLPVR
jgi:hypothetical protein